MCGSSPSRVTRRRCSRVKSPPTRISLNEGYRLRRAPTTSSSTSIRFRGTVLPTCRISGHVKSAAPRYLNATSSARAIRPRRARGVHPVWHDRQARGVERHRMQAAHHAWRDCRTQSFSLPRDPPTAAPRAGARPSTVLRCRAGSPRRRRCRGTSRASGPAATR